MCCNHLKKILEIDNTKDSCFSNSSSADENGKKFLLENPGQKLVCRVKVDNCLVEDNTISKCDYFFTVCNKKSQKTEIEKYFFVELKGGDVGHAVKQIDATFKLLNKSLKAPAQNCKGVIIATRVPSGTDQGFRRLQDEFYRKNRFQVIARTKQCNEKV